MRVMFLITKAESGGAQSHLLELVRGLSESHNVLVVCGEAGPLLSLAAAAGAGTHVLGSLVHPIRPLKDVGAIVSAVKLIRSFKPDLIHAHSTKAGIVGRLAAWFAEVPAVFTAHGWAFTEG